jgi:hypothetical protein
MDSIVAHGGVNVKAAWGSDPAQMIAIKSVPYTQL